MNTPLKFEVSRDFLDALLVQHPPKQSGANNELRVNAGVRFLPSSPDGTLHTAVVQFHLNIDGVDQPFIQGGWRFLFSTNQRYDLTKEENQQHDFFRGMLAVGTQKLVAVMNPLCLHANMPLIPALDFNRAQRPAGAQPPAAAGGATA